MEKYTGPGLKNLSQKDLNKFKKERDDLGFNPHPAELEKTLEEEKLLKSLINSIDSEMKNLGLPIINFPVEKIHLLPQHFYWHPGTESKTVACFTDSRDDIEAQISRKKNITPVEKIKDNMHKLLHLEPISYLSNIDKDAKHILHELIHAKSKRGFFINPSEEIIPYKSGYNTSKFLNNKEPFKKDSYFSGLNEAVTEKITKELLLKDKDIILNSNETDNLKQEILKDSAYSGYIKVLDKIIETLAMFEDKTPDEIWTRFKKNYFTGEMMHLRKIEEIFGIGSLRVLASMNPLSMSVFELEKESKFMEYFSYGTGYEKREELAKEILSEDEYDKKEKHEEIMQNHNKYL